MLSYFAYDETFYFVILNYGKIYDIKIIARHDINNDWKVIERKKNGNLKLIELFILSIEAAFGFIAPWKRNV